MKILRVWLIAICLSSISLSEVSDLDSKITEFAHSPEWLGHFFYDGDRAGYTSLVESKHYFFSSTGKYSPEDELKETVRRLSVPEEIPQEEYCHYVARYELVLAVFPQFRKSGHQCKAFEEWSQKLALDSVRMSFATGYIKNPASSFGHLFLKLVSRNQNSDLLNYGINFSAQTGDDTDALYALKGLFGQYPGGFVFLPYHQLIKDYSDLEGRDIWELDLDFDDIAKRRLLLFIYEFDSNYVDYTFMNNNCAGILERLIDYLQRRPVKTSLQMKPWTMPLESFLNISSAIKDKKYFYRPSLKTQLLQMDDRLTEKQKLQISDEAKLGNYNGLDARSLDYVILDKKINEPKLDENQYLKLLTARSRLPVDTETSGKAGTLPEIKVDDRSRTSSIGIVGNKEGSGLDLNLLNERLIYRHSLSEINIFNLQVRTDKDKQPILAEVEIFNFLAGEPVSFLRSPISYGGGLFYRSKQELVLEASAGYMLNLKDWLYFSRLHFIGDKFRTELFPKVDVFYFNHIANLKLNIQSREFGIEAFRFIEVNYSIRLSSVYDTQNKEIRYLAGASYFY
ncbi:MAG: hypothetical protein B7Y39_09090 [Bdellovibrio sp. 28-41-41]|nr:MAG: hypothetical protein B7Y39_09090 [Bdellovibrio sp. 28-41-41]